jgi:peptidoglycan/LPS O-acetylase OafA/YrhL
MIEARHKILGIDSIRFICAIFVLLGHYGNPLHFAATVIPSESRYINGLLGCMFNGPAAVIVFFIISGFCIHFPNRTSPGILLAPFYIQRFVRIGVPAAFAIMLWLIFGLGGELKAPDFGVFWSIICEIIYYAIYPALLTMARRKGWPVLIVGSYLMAAAMVISHVPELRAFNNSYTALGLWTWVVGLPCWLMGCWLAENFQRFRRLPAFHMWTLRLFVITTSVLLRILKFHVHSILASNCISLDVFAVLAGLWVGCEAAYFMEQKPFRFSEWGGTWSYSLYIIHPVAAAIVTYLFGHAVFNIAPIFFAFLCSYLFFGIIEFPAHTLAKALSRRYRKRSIGEMPGRIHGK